MKILFFILSIFISSSVFAQNLTFFNTKDLSKAKGLDITIKYPSDWKKEESPRPNIVQKFTKNYSNFLGMMMLQVNNVNADELKTLKNGSIDVWRQLNNESPSKVLKIIKTKIEEQDAYISDTVFSDERVGVNINVRLKVMQLLYKDKLITMNCGITTTNTSNENELNNLLNQINKECLLFFNSLVLVQRY